MLPLSQQVQVPRQFLRGAEQKQPQVPAALSQFAVCSQDGAQQVCGRRAGEGAQQRLGYAGRAIFETQIS